LLTANQLRHRKEGSKAKPLFPTKKERRNNCRPCRQLYFKERKKERKKEGNNRVSELTVALSRVFMIFSSIVSWAVMNPSRLPGAMILEKLSTRMTRPSGSRERKDGTIGLSAPFSRICRKQSGGSSAASGGRPLDSQGSSSTISSSHFLQTA